MSTIETALKGTVSPVQTTREAKDFRLLSRAGSLNYLPFEYSGLIMEGSDETAELSAFHIIHCNRGAISDQWKDADTDALAKAKYPGYPRRRPWLRRHWSSRKSGCSNTTHRFS